MRLKLSWPPFLLSCSSLTKEHAKLWYVARFKVGFFGDLKFQILIVEVISWLQYIWCRDLFFATEDFPCLFSFPLANKSRALWKKNPGICAAGLDSNYLKYQEKLESTSLYVKAVLLKAQAYIYMHLYVTIKMECTGIFCKLWGSYDP